MCVWVDSPFLNHPTQNAFVDFYGVFSRENLGNENALPALQSCWNQSLHCLIQEPIQMLWIVDKNV
jgi:hypothetical protein